VITVAWSIAGLAIGLLAVASWQRNTRPAIRAVLAVSASISLGTALTGSAWTLALLALDVILVAATWQLARWRRMNTAWGIAWIVLLVSVLVAAKLSQGQVVMPVAGPAAWIGVSYFIFRLIHVSLDARRDRLGEATLSETLVYALHPATLLAGPIDRVQHSVVEQRCAIPEPSHYVRDGLWRLFVGLFKKLALANLFYGFVAANDVFRRSNPTPLIGWLWLLAYALYLYFDFAAYSDIAIGVARLMGLRLPENFANPYLQPNITRFWQAWHITLSTWLRDYIFFPLSRGLLRRFGSRFAALILLISHVTTMVICGLWHGLTAGFAIWGLWHGLGLFAHSQIPALRRRFALPALPAAFGTAFTFLFVTLGWVFFNNELGAAFRMFGALFGLR
jgi:alginate O-acetyltransferase complex protein AlgI